MTGSAGRRFVRRPGAVAFVLTIVLGAFAPWVFPNPAAAHTPHDDVSDVVPAPTYAQDGKVFVIAGNRLFVSEASAYHWKPVVRGLPRPPEDGKSLSQIAIGPSDPATMYVSSRIGGVFRSVDAGRTFRQAVGGLVNPDISAIAVSPRSAGVVLSAGTLQGFYRTDDGGRHWTTLPGFNRVPTVAFLGQSGRAVAGDDAGRVMISDDNGATWTAASTGNGSINAVAASTGASPATVFAGDAFGRVLRSSDGGSSFAMVGRGLPSDQVVGLATSPDYDRDHTVWASLAEHGVYRSTDGGESWVRASSGLTTDMQAHVVQVASFRGIVAAAGPEGTTLYEAAFDGLFHSSDGGDTWKESQTVVDFITGLGVSPDYAHDRTVAIAGYVKGAYLSEDAGKRWRPIDHGLYEAPGAGNKFATIRRLHNITFSPDYANDRTLFSAGWTVFLKSSNGGASWTQIQVSRPSPLLRQYVLGIAPDYASRHQLYLGTRQGDIYRSDRAGDPGSWSHVGTVPGRVRSFAFDPSGESLFVGTIEGVLRSDNGGATWKPSGPSGESLVAISPGYANDGTIFSGSLGNLYVSRNRAKAWRRVSMPSTSKVEAVAVSPDFPSDGTVLVSLAGQGLYKSTDHGHTFTPTGADLLASGHIIADYTNPTGSPIQFSRAFAKDHTVFAYAGQDVVRSTDGGTTWAVLHPPSAESFLPTVRQATAAAPGSQAVSASSGSSSGISKRRVAAVVLVVFVVLALLAFLAFRRSRRSGIAGSADGSDRDAG